MGTLSGNPNAGIFVGLEGGINITNVFGRRCISSAGSGDCNARGPSAGTRRKTIRFPACALLNIFAGNNDPVARTAEPGGLRVAKRDCRTSLSSKGAAAKEQR